MYVCVYIYVCHAQECNIFLPASCPRARASCLYALAGTGHGAGCTVIQGLLATTWTVSLASGTASLAPVMVCLAGTTGYGKPNTSDSKSDIRDGASGTTGAWHRGKPGTRDGAD